MARSDGATAATDLVIAAHAVHATVRRPLIVGETTGRLRNVLAANGAEPSVWTRLATATGTEQAAAWPPDGPFDAAFVRLPKDRESLRMSLHAAFARLPPGAPLVLFGMNDEGMRSAGKWLAEVADAVETVATGRHARVVAGRRKVHVSELQAALADWRTVRPIALAGASRPWVGYPGLFAKGGLDDGTRLLLQHVPQLSVGQSALDFAAGTGVIAAALSQGSPGIALTLLDADALAIEAARENVPGARLVLAASLAPLDNARFDLIVSNPPLHDGVGESHAVLDHLIREAPRHLTANGRLLLVVQRRVPIARLLGETFAHQRFVADDGRFTVAEARGASLRKL